MAGLLKTLLVLTAFAHLAVAGIVLPSEAHLTVSEKETASAKRVWIVPEYFGLMTKKSPYPDFPLVTKGDLGTAKGGILGAPGTTVEFDRNGESFGVQHGFKLSAGGWITDDRGWGAELSGFLNPEVSEQRSVSMDFATRLTIPYYDGRFGEEQAFSYNPMRGITAAGITITNKQQFWGVSALALRQVHQGKNIGIDLKLGIRSQNLEDEFGFRQAMTTIVPKRFAELGAFPRTATATDSFKGRNNFVGASVGARIFFNYGRLRAEIQPQLAVGGNMQTVSIRGQSTAVDTITGAYHVRNQGFWALDTNIGEYQRARLGVIPEINLNIGVEILKNLEFKAGYSFMYWNDVVRGGDHVSRVINVDKTPIYGYGPLDPLNPALPTFRYRSTDFWAHGISVGFTVRF